MASSQPCVRGSHKFRKLWWKSRRSLNTCCSKKIVLLLAWTAFFTFSRCTMIKVIDDNMPSVFTMVSMLVSKLLAPLIGWLADVKLGRYETIKFASLFSFIANVLIFFAFINESEGAFKIIASIALAIASVCFTCVSVAMLPFLTDQLIGATSDELSAVVYWYFWSLEVGVCLSDTMFVFGYYPDNAVINNIYMVCIIAVPLALIIMSDCLCLKWIDRTHKVTNPIKLIIQVLNYTKKHRYPERRSAFTYIDEEQPSRIDFGKEKFGGPFTEEEVEDVKTVLRLLPLVACICLSGSGLSLTPIDLLPENSITNVWLTYGINTSWLFTIPFIPFYQFIIRPLIHNHKISMLKCIGICLFLRLLAELLMEAICIKSVFDWNDVQRYISCTRILNSTKIAGDNIALYWKIPPFILFEVGKTMTQLLLLEWIIAQSPDKMKGFVIGTKILISAFVPSALLSVIMNLTYTICYDMVTIVTLSVLFVIFLILSKRYTLRERNREINIQAIAEEHYERYMDQEDEYERVHGNDDYDSSSSDPDTPNSNDSD